MSLPNTSFLPVVPLSIPFKKSPSSFLNCCSLTCLFLGVRTRHVHTYLQTAEAAPPLTSIPITMLAAASLHHYTRQDHHARCCISSSLHKARSPCSLLHLFITTSGKNRVALPTTTERRSCNNLPQLATHQAYYFYRCYLHQPFSYLHYYTTTRTKCSVFFRDTISLILSSQINFPIYETIIPYIWNNENPSICLYLN